MANTKGIDISHWNTCTNYAAARAAIDWVYIKVSEGPSVKDPARGTHFNGFSGKPRGAYHFMRGSSTTEVANFVTEVRARAWELPPMLDAEYPGVTGAAIKAFLKEYQRQTGQELIVVYSGKANLQGACAPATFATPNTVVWAARYYQNNPTFSTLGWDHAQLGIYQYWNAGSVPGFTGGIDMDIARVPLTGGAANNNLGEEDMDATQARQLAEVHLALFGSAQTIPGLEDRDEALAIWGQVSKVLELVAALNTGGIDINALADAVASKFTVNIADAVIERTKAQYNK